ncbi:hypothetical protein F4819DRAFT_479866 [Hypoxylon fuscum]|nr:hypothetical protein F4819DRAFT_479866 [Hypoxylon fuscum]
MTPIFNPKPSFASQQDTSSFTAGEPLIIDSHSISLGSVVAVDLYRILYNDDYFPESFVFRLER